MFKIAVSIIFLFLSHVTSAAVQSTGEGKVIFTEGHSTPACRIVRHKENNSGIERTFRISGVSGDDDVNSVILAALISNRDIAIFYDTTVTTGCGTEPKITYVRIY